MYMQTMGKCNCRPGHPVKAWSFLSPAEPEAPAGGYIGYPRSFVRPSVRPSVCHADFSKTAERIFMILGP